MNTGLRRRLSDTHSKKIHSLSLLLLAGDVGAICLIDAEVNKQKLDKPFSLTVDLRLIHYLFIYKHIINAVALRI